VNAAPRAVNGGAGACAEGTATVWGTAIAGRPSLAGRGNSAGAATRGVSSTSTLTAVSHQRTGARPRGVLGSGEQPAGPPRADIEPLAETVPGQVANGDVAPEVPVGSLSLKTRDKSNANGLRPPAARACTREVKGLEVRGEAELEDEGVEEADELEGMELDSLACLLGPGSSAPPPSPCRWAPGGSP